MWDTNTYWLMVRGGRGFKAWEFRQNRVIRGRMFIQAGACTEFSAFWLREALVADRNDTPVRFGLNMDDKVEEAQWIRASLGNVSFIPHRMSLRSWGVKFEDMISQFNTINDPLIDLFFHEQKTGYLIFGATHTVALMNAGLKFFYFDPNFGSAMFFSLADSLAFMRRSWAEHYADGDTFVEKYKLI